MVIRKNEFSNNFRRSAKSVDENIDLATGNVKSKKSKTISNTYVPKKKTIYYRSKE